MADATAAMRPDRIDTSPSKTSRRSFIVTTMPLRTRRDDTVDVFRSSLRSMCLRGSLFTPCERRRVPFHGQFRGVAAREFSVLDGDQLCQDADGYLLWRDGANVEPDGCVYPLEALDRETFRLQRVVNPRDLCAAADETEVPHILFRQRAKGFEIVGMTARHDHDIGVRRQVCLCQPRGNVFGHHFCGGRKALPVCEFFTVVNDVDLKTDFLREIREAGADVTGANHVKLG